MRHFEDDKGLLVEDINELTPRRFLGDGTDRLVPWGEDMFVSTHDPGW